MEPNKQARGRRTISAIPKKTKQQEVTNAVRDLEYEDYMNHAYYRAQGERAVPC